MTSEQISLNEIELRLKSKYQASLTDASVSQMHDAISEEAMENIAEEWFNTRHRRGQARRAYYFSAEYMMGRMLYNNLYALGLLNKVRDAFLARGMDIAAFEEIEDAALGNGGLGRLAACYLDSAATHSLPLDGYGLRYKFGLFKQSFRDGFQVESADDWQRQGDPWSIRRDTHSVQVEFLNQTVHAIPYDMPVIGYRSNDIATLRLWQSEPMEEFDFQAFNDQQYDRAVREKNAVEDITRVLYPNDSTFTGKQLRLKQQYFLSSASLQDIIHNFKRNNNGSLENFKSLVCVQLNDTHPVVSIPELVRLLMREGFDFDAALDTARHVFSYTNHTVMAEALEKWDVELFKSVIPHVFDVIYRINARFCGELLERGVANIEKISIIQETTIHMANLAGYCCRTVNGVARIHTEILKHDVLKNFYNLYPDKFINITNGVTQRRWLALCNPELSGFITRRIGDGWIKDLSRLSGLKGYLSDADVEEFNAIKRAKKRRLSALIEKTERVALPPHFVFDVQVKRMHEYKRQLMNAFSVLDTYYGLKEGRIQNYMPTAVIFGAKAAPGYWRAKGIIKFIQDIAAKINADPAMNDLLKMVFVTNYNCSYAEHIIPAADVSEQISPAGTEASGTGNMKLMLNGAVTLGTYDGATVEIVEEAGAENNFIFGKSVAELNAIRAYYNPYDIYNNEPRVRRLVDALVDGTFGKLDIYTEIHDSLLSGNYGMPDRYFVLLELMEYIAAKERVNAACRDSAAFGRMCLMNTAGAGKFSSDRAVGEYAGEIWHVRAMPEA